MVRYQLYNNRNLLIWHGLSNIFNGFRKRRKDKRKRRSGNLGFKDGFGSPVAAAHSRQRGTMTHFVHGFRRAYVNGR